MPSKKAPPRTMAESVRRFRKSCIKTEGDKPIKLAGGLVINKKKDLED
jgi:hypothetical protein